ncbi:MAG: S4 domain-containing protein, partial [Arenibacter sp.]
MEVQDEFEFNEEELFEHHSFKASKGQDPLRIDNFLMNFIENATRNKIQQAARDGNVWVNGATVKQNYKVKA